MWSDVKVAVVFNEPVGSDGGSSSSTLSAVANSYVSQSGQFVDLLEVGVLEERLQVEKALQQKGFSTIAFNINGDIQRLLDFLLREKPTVVFNLCESLLGQAINEMHVAGLFELAGVVYTGSSPITLGTCLNKVRTKEILAYHSIPTARHQVFARVEELTRDSLALSFPLIVKPLREDASAGIENSSVVRDFENLQKRVEKIVTEFKQPALVEEYIDGRELNVAILGNTFPRVLPISEIDFSGLPEGYPRIVTYNAKWLEGSPEYNGTVGKCPADLPADVEAEVSDIALRAYRIMEVRDYARVDIRLDGENKPYVLEVNPNPDISRDAGYIRSAKAAGLSFEDVMEEIVRMALERCKK